MVKNWSDEACKARSAAASVTSGPVFRTESGFCFGSNPPTTHLHDTYNVPFFSFNVLLFLASNLLLVKGLPCANMTSLRRMHWTSLQSDAMLGKGFRDSTRFDDQFIFPLEMAMDALYLRLHSAGLVRNQDSIWLMHAKRVIGPLRLSRRMRFLLLSYACT